MFEKRFLKKYMTAAAVLLVIFMFGIFFREHISAFVGFVSDREKINSYLLSYGSKAPIAFILLQISQVIFAPVPGEASGIIGGYLFGTVPGFLYSSIGLSLGSAINLSLGRILGKRFIRRVVPREKFNKIDSVVSRQGLFMVFLLFIFPGFPKDYLCLFLGISGLPIIPLFLLATAGRMPGTFLLSLQGASVYDEMYGVAATVLICCLVLGIIFFKYRKAFLKWVEGRKK